MPWIAADSILVSIVESFKVTVMKTFQVYVDFLSLRGEEAAESGDSFREVIATVHLLAFGVKDYIERHAADIKVAQCRVSQTGGCPQSGHIMQRVAPERRLPAYGIGAVRSRAIPLSLP